MREKFSSFHDYIQGKKIVIIGAGISNTPLVSLFMKHGCESVCVRDRKELDEATKHTFLDLGAQVICGNTYLDDLCADLIIRTPGLRPDVAPLVKAREQGARVVGETQLFLEFAPCKVFGVTGSDGKTTTTTLISKLLESAGKKVYLGGNIGTPLLPLIDEIQKEDIACLELSSFQLMDGEFSPDVSVITNISENHLDWHTNMDEYTFAKQNIYSHQSNEGILILNADDPHSDEFKRNAPGRVRYFSLKTPQEDGAYLQENRLVLRSNGMENCPFHIEDIRIPGRYNVANYLAALCAVSSFLYPENAKEVAQSFNGVEHRVEWIRTLNGVRYYNSSIDSSPSRTIATLGAFNEKLTVICGGYDKNLDYSVLKPHFVERAKAVYVTGQTADKILAALQDPKAPYTISRHSDIKDALYCAKENTKEGDVIILSPASASFDAFKNFEERGRYFKELVRAL